MSVTDIPLLAGLDSRLPTDGLDALRRKAFDVVRAEGLPGVANENWKYSGTRELLETAYQLDGEEQDHAFEGVQRFELDCDRLVFVNGRYEARYSNDVSACTVLPLQDAIASHADDISALAGADFDVEDIANNGFAALNAALSDNGLYIKLDRGTEIKRPLHVIFLSTEEASPLQSHPALFFDLADNARLTLIESHIGVGKAANFTNIACRGRLASGARLEHIRLLEGSDEGITEDRQVSNTFVNVGRDADYTQQSIALGQRFVRNDLRVALNEPGAHAELNGLFVCSGSQHVDNHLLVEHLAPHTTSSQVYRGVADGRGRGVFNGKVYVAKDAQKADANQASNNLLLSRGAEIDTKPELEIYADDVKCSHGATIGQLDNNMLFYLQSRGIDAETARALLIFAFVDEIVKHVPFPSIRAHLEAQLVGRLPDADILRAFMSDEESSQ